MENLSESFNHTEQTDWQLHARQMEIKTLNQSWQNTIKRQKLAREAIHLTKEEGWRYKERHPNDTSEENNCE